MPDVAMNYVFSVPFSSQDVHAALRAVDVLMPASKRLDPRLVDYQARYEMDTAEIVRAEPELGLPFYGELEVAFHATKVTLWFQQGTPVISYDVTKDFVVESVWNWLMAWGALIQPTMRRPE